MNFKFWSMRWLKVFLVIFCILAGAYLTKGYEALDALLASLLWSAVSTTVFVATRMFYVNKGQSCELCGDDAGKK